jgi:hypothetical protein
MHELDALTQQQRAAFLAVRAKRFSCRKRQRPGCRKHRMEASADVTHRWKNEACDQRGGKAVRGVPSTTIVDDGVRAHLGKGQVAECAGTACVSAASDSNVRAPAGHRVVHANHRSKPPKNEAAEPITTTNKVNLYLIVIHAVVAVIYLDLKA